MLISPCSKEKFVSSITDDPADRFAKRFVAKANMSDYWGNCFGMYAADDLMGSYEDEDLMGAIITTVSKRAPYVANLQLLHTFAKHRRRGVAKRLCEQSLKWAIDNGAEYFRVSSEPEARVFYESLGFVFLGAQKTAYLSMFRINGPTFKDGIYDINDPVINKAVYRKGKGGCIEVYVQPDKKPELPF